MDHHFPHIRGVHKIGAGSHAFNGLSGTSATPLVRFDLRQIAPTATVSSVQLQVYVIARPQTFELCAARKLTEAWAEGAQNGASDVANWDTRDITKAWSTAGGTYDSTVHGVSPLRDGTLSITLLTTGVSVVAGWVADPTTNFGFALGTPDPAGMPVPYTLASREDADPTHRPKLVVVLGP